MAQEQTLSKKRALAVETHDNGATWFEQEYQTLHRDAFATAFGYGRAKLDALLQQELRTLAPGAAVLDVGCGTGEQVRMFREMGFQPTGVEPALRMRESAQRMNPGVTIVDGSILALPFPDASFDFVCAIEVLRYLDQADWESGFAEMLRVLRPGGKLFVTLVNRYALDGFYVQNKLKTLALRLVGREPEAYHAFVTPGEVRQLLERARARNVRLFGRMLAPLRIAYKLHPAVGSRLARALDTADDAISDRDWHVPFAGHLVVVAERATA